MTPRPEQEQFEGQAGYELAQAGITQVSANANPLWKAYAFKCAYEVAIANPSFTVDQVKERMQATPEKEPYIHNRSALGPVLVKLAKAGYIESTNEYRASLKPADHGQPRRVWKSNIYAGSNI